MTDNSKAIELKLCPFCGGSADVWDDYRGEYGGNAVWVVGCNVCDAELTGPRNDKPTPHYPDEKQKTIDAWNTRAALEAQAEPVLWQYTDEYGDEAYTTIKAHALEFDPNPMPLYATPPTTAEVKAEALEEMADKLSGRVYDALTAGGVGLAVKALREEAKRLREEV